MAHWRPSCGARPDSPQLAHDARDARSSQGGPFRRRSDQLVDEELEVVGLGHAQKDGVVWRLLARLHLAQLHARVMGGLGHHACQALGRHEVRARASGQVAAAWQQAQRLVVDLLVAVGGVVGRAAAFGERRRVEHDEVERPALGTLQGLVGTQGRNGKSDE